MRKRLFDFVVACAMFVFALPVMAVIAIALLATGAAPLFFQERIGLNGCPFVMWKFKTMRPGSEKVIRVATAGDERITFLGRLLRRYHLDELPQLVNVIRGDMSLVGPRPTPFAHMEDLVGTANYSKRLSVRPGMTGLVQIRGRERFIKRGWYGWQRVFRLDAFYAEHRCGRFDLKILLKTIPTVFTGKGI